MLNPITSNPFGNGFLQNDKSLPTGLGVNSTQNQISKVGAENTPNILKDLGVDTTQIEQKVDQDIQNTIKNTLSLDDYYNKLDLLKKNNPNSSDKEIWKLGLELSKQKGYIIDGIDIDKELADLGDDTQTNSYKEQPQEDNKDENFLGQIANVGKDLGNTLKTTSTLEINQEDYKTLGGSMKNELKRLWNTGGKFLVNIPGDTIEGIGDLLGIIAHPVETVKSAGELLGALKDVGIDKQLNKVFGTNFEVGKDSEEIIKNIGEELDKNFGSVDKATKTISENPMDTLFILKGALDGGAKLAVKQGNKEAAKLMKDVSKGIDPLKLQGEGINLIKQGGKGMSKALIGKASGLGSEGVGDIFKYGKTKEFAKAMDGNIKVTKAVDDLSKQISNMKKGANTAFGKELENLGAITKTKKIGDITQKFKNELINKYGIDIKKDGISLNPKKSIIIEDDLPYLKQAIDRVHKLKGGLTPVELRNQVKYFKSIEDKLGTPEKGPFRTIRKSLEDEINNISKGYSRMNADYAKTKSVLKELEDTFGNPNIKTETKINKLNMVLRDNQDYKKFMLSLIDNPDTIKATLSGLQARDWLPRGLMGQIGAGSILGLASTGGLSLMTLSTFGLASPKVLGKLAKIFGKTEKQTSKFLQEINKYYGKGKKVLQNGVKGADVTSSILETTNLDSNQ